MKFLLKCNDSPPACRDRIVAALKSEGCLVYDETDNAIKAEGDVSKASVWFTSPLMRTWGSLVITVFFDEPLTPKVSIALSFAGHFWQVVSIAFLGSITAGVGLLLFLAYPWITKHGLKKQVEGMKAALRNACASNEAK